MSADPFAWLVAAVLSLFPAPPGPFLTPPQQPAATLSAQPRDKARPLRLHGPVDGEDYGDCVSHRWVDRTLPAGADALHDSLRALFAGPTAAERAQGFRSVFDGSSPSGQPAPPLAHSFRSVRLTKDGVAIVDFSADAMAQLNSAACFQTAVKSAIERTLLQFVEVKQVAYAIDGQIVDEWDA